jgi:hypothetical protein
VPQTVRGQGDPLRDDFVRDDFVPLLETSREPTDVELSVHVKPRGDTRAGWRVNFQRASRFGKCEMVGQGCRCGGRNDDDDGDTGGIGAKPPMCRPVGRQQIRLLRQRKNSFYQAKTPSFDLCSFTDLRCQLEGEVARRRRATERRGERGQGDPLRDDFVPQTVGRAGGAGKRSSPWS